ncbi:integrase core domain protein [Ancylostoma ceylanicum]|uniref:Integrase core domain protein n=1 Tax=Ancylostoma ceylanicum TaxID=53326 RepID=A0A0D6LD61_9BILA|nr:integrase core domain protein [Ancylostoma ceylanicum]
MPDLPKERVTRNRPFQNIGVDYMGPIQYRDAFNSPSKSWTCLMTCMATRAIHLESVINNSTAEFLLALRRFVARRGIPSIIYSDNATTFRSAADALNKLLLNPTSYADVSAFCANRKIEWRFITPLSPWKGGFYERMIGLFKSIFRKSMGRNLLRLEQLHTLVVEIEAVLNSRPITPFYDNDSFVQVLRPIDFIVPEVELQIPKNARYDPTLTLKLSEWYKETTCILDRFWELWRKEYLAALMERQQARIRQPKYTRNIPEIGDVVIVGDQNTPRDHWPIALIVNLNRDDRNIARTATIKLAGNGKMLERSLNQLIPLEIRAKETLSQKVNSTF